MSDVALIMILPDVVAIHVELEVLQSSRLYL